jgi:hypothetical protein
MEIKIDSQELADVEQRAMQRDMLVNVFRVLIDNGYNIEPGATIEVPMERMETVEGMLSVDVKEGGVLTLELNKE